MKIVHQCNTTVGWQPVRVDSSSREGRAYVVHVNPWGRVDENICECEGYIYGGRCKHQKLASATLCGWHELIGPEKQAPEQRRVRQCPRCGGATTTTVEEYNEV